MFNCINDISKLGLEKIVCHTSMITNKTIFTVENIKAASGCVDNVYFLCINQICIDCFKYSALKDLSQLFLLKNPLVINLRSIN